jgi:hypothetical protein
VSRPAAPVTSKAGRRCAASPNRRLTFTVRRDLHGFDHQHRDAAERQDLCRQQTAPSHRSEFALLWPNATCLVTRQINRPRDSRSHPNPVGAIGATCRDARRRRPPDRTKTLRAVILIKKDLLERRIFV